jgi:hypothetical protein
MLATAFLNLAAESNLANVSERISSEEYTSYFPKIYSEDTLRALELRFHNLQSLYDTYVSETETEVLDSDLPVLRGHISVVFHLLRTATEFAHYYERHLIGHTGKDSRSKKDLLMVPETLLEMLINYSMNFASSYIESAQRLCQSMLKHYAQIDRIEAPVPKYRGFHVRPSTLIAKLVHHYGSEVKMQLDNETYDASSPLELFRANEKINASKRRWLAEEIVKLKLKQKKTDSKDIKDIIRHIVLRLAEQGKLILYQQPLQMPEDLEISEGTLPEQIKSVMAHLLVIGKIDIDTNLKVTFIGDQRVLADIKLLAEYGYGEDNFGNNITLAKNLDYLRR